MRMLAFHVRPEDHCSVTGHVYGFLQTSPQHLDCHAVSLSSQPHSLAKLSYCLHCYEGSLCSQYHCLAIGGAIPMCEANMQPEA